VIRGAFRGLIPLGGGGHDTLISQLAIRCTLTDHDVRLSGDFTLYVSAVADTPLADGQGTSVTLTPGMLTHLGRGWYFLASVLPAPGSPRNGQEPIVDGDTLDEFEPATRSAVPGRYHIGEISANPLASGHASRRLGLAIKRADGSVAVKPDPWPWEPRGSRRRDRQPPGRWIPCLRGQARLWAA
jgi:hypothetical protein